MGLRKQAKRIVIQRIMGEDKKIVFNKKYQYLMTICRGEQPDCVEVGEKEKIIKLLEEML